MSVTTIFDDLTTDGHADEGPVRRTPGGGIVVAVGRRPSPVPRRATVPRADPAHATAFGQGCLDDDLVAERDGELPRLLEAARHEAQVLGHGRVGTEHLLLAVVRAGDEVGRAFGLRRAGVALVAAACDAAAVTEPLVAPDGTIAPTEMAAAALDRARRRAAARDRRPGAADLGLALLDAGRSARLLADLGVDRDDLADVLAREELGVPPVPVAPASAPVSLVPPDLPDPSSAPGISALTAPLRIGPPPGSPARRLGRRRLGALTRPADGPALDLPA